MLPVLIVGAGVVGLTLAQGLKKRGIPYLIFERDGDAGARGQGWGITLHWCLGTLYETLDESLHEKILDTQVDPEQGRRIDKANFLYLNACTGEIVWKIPPNRNLRLKRESFRQLLMQDIDIQFNKTFARFEVVSDGIIASFTDGSSFKGSLLVGADGSKSYVRRQLLPDTYHLQQLPIRFIGVSYRITESAVEPLRAIDPVLFQGTNPQTNDFIWYSILDTPATNGGSYYTIQINVSWPLKSPDDEVKATNAERLADMKRRGAGMAEPMRSAILNIPDDTKVIEVRLADWPCLEWDGKGRVTLIGDAAHAMTMFRGQAANHGITDAYNLCLMLQRERQNPSTLQAELAQYESDMRERAAPAVLLSRQACIDAHDWTRLKEGSPALAKRAQKV